MKARDGRPVESCRASERAGMVQREKMTWGVRGWGVGGIQWVMPGEQSSLIRATNIDLGQTRESGNTD